MFPYLKYKEEFIKDCEDARFSLKKTEEKSYILRENNLSEKGFYSQTRGCSYKINCDGNCKKIKKGEICPNNACKWIYDEKKTSAVEENSRDDQHEYIENCMGNGESGCRNISSLVADLTENVNKANWGQEKGISVGTVKVKLIQSWCQSLGIYIHDVLKNVKGRVAVGLEYYVDNSVEGSGRADVILAGYGRDKRGKIIIIELKQNDNRYFTTYKNSSIKDAEDKALEQVISYCRSIENTCEDPEKIKIDFYPCVYFHNFFSDTLSKKIEKDGWEVSIFYGGTNTEKDRTKGIKEISGFIGDIICDDKKDPKDVIRKLKACAKTFSTAQMAAIVYGKAINTKTGKWEKVDYEGIYRKLRPDQKYAFDKIKNAIDKGVLCDDPDIKIINRVNGTSGSGKTLLMVLLLRYCLDHKKRVLLSYFGVSPINAIFKKELFGLVKKDLEGKISRKKIPDSLKRKAVKEIEDLTGEYFNPSADMKKLREAAKKYDISLPPAVTRLKNFTIAHSEKTDTVLKAREKFDLFIYDEFHRFSYNRSVKESCQNIEKIIARSESTVLLTDELQRLTGKDISGEFFNSLSPDKYLINRFSLWSQFRCGSDEGYVTWVENVLQIENTPEEKNAYVVRKKGKRKNISLKELDFNAEIARDAKEVENLIIKSKKAALLSEGSGAEISRLFRDKRVRNLICKENEHGNTKTRGRNCSILLKNSFNTQGIEFDEVVVIIDKNIDYKNKKICFAKPVSGVNTEEELNFLKNKYRVLLTRGLKKCTIYAVNKDLREYLLSQK